MGMCFCDVIKEILKDFDKKFPKFLDDMNKSIEKAFGLKDSMMYIIGSGSHFEFLFNCDYEHAYEEYKKMSVFYSVGNCVDKVSAYHALLEKYYAMESSTGYVFCYIMPIDNMRDIGINLIDSEVK